MKQFIPVLSVAVVLCSNTLAFAEVFEGKCLYLDQENSENKFHSCLINSSSSNLSLTFKSSKYQSGNQAIGGNSITQIASGNYAKRLLSDSGSIIGGILFAPLGIASRIFKKDYQMYVLDYKKQGNQTATIIRIKQKEAPKFQQELRTLARNMLITFEESKKSTVIDVGPDFKK
ncbi:hypothetical protein AM10699_62290 (plasmid) [Acaryochloris marina MBIC10699]|nr:hypothetical protein AM10699_62290 [Acaryochloris marina MBIC10699]